MGLLDGLVVNRCLCARLFPKAFFRYPAAVAAVFVAAHRASATLHVEDMRGEAQNRIQERIDHRAHDASQVARFRIGVEDDPAENSGHNNCPILVHDTALEPDEVAQRKRKIRFANDYSPGFSRQENDRKAG